MATPPIRSASVPELTVRGIVLGGLITLVFTAANVYLGLKVGLTFATSIPAAVISMAVLRLFAGSSILGPLLFIALLAWLYRRTARPA